MRDGDHGALTFRATLLRVVCLCYSIACAYSNEIGKEEDRLHLGLTGESPLLYIPS